MNLRRFIYADVERINSFFSQLYGDIETISSQEEQSISKKLDAQVQLPSIFHGFLSGNLSGEIERDRGISSAINIKVSIEKKVELLVASAAGTESNPLKASPLYHDHLVLGKADIASSEFFSGCNRDILQSHDCQDILDFLRKASSIDGFITIWENMRNAVVIEQSIARDHIIPIMAVMAHPLKANVVKQLITINAEKPIIIPFSLGKILLSASDVESVNYIYRTTSFRVLGFLSKTNTNVYVLKPLAMWTIIKCSPVEREEHIRRGQHI